MRKLRRWLMVSLAGLAMLVAFVFSNVWVDNVFAVDALSSTDIAAYKQNALFKVIYSNLSSCYANEMKSPITVNAETVRQPFNSSTYFTEEGLASYAIRYPYGIKGPLGGYSSSCPDLIMGWNTWWGYEIFNGAEDHIGLLGMQTGVTVPTANYESNKLETMTTFLKNIGYSPDRTTTKNDDKCFYFDVTLNSDVYNALPEKPVFGGNSFTTVDFCVKQEDGKVTSVYYLTGKGDRTSSYEEYDGHIRDNSNVLYTIFTNGGYAPEVITHKWGGSASSTFLQSNLYAIGMSYRTSLQDTTAGVSLVSNLPFVYQAARTATDAKDNCAAFGYTWCDSYTNGALWPFNSTTNIFSVVPGGGTSGFTIDQMKSGLQKLLNAAKVKMSGGQEYYLFNSVTAKDFLPGSDPDSYIRGNSNTKFLNYFLKNVSKYNGGKFTDAEKYILYWYYLKNNYGTTTSTREVENSVKVSWLDEGTGTFSEVYIYNAADNSDTYYYKLDSNNKWENTVRAYSMGNWKTFADELAKIDVEKAFDAKVTSIIDPGINPDGQPDDEPGVPAAEDPCYKAAGSLGWIVCPVIKIVSDTLVGVYDTMIQPFLEIKSNWLEVGSGQSVYAGWSAFRNFANIIFAILFLIVIFSQVTGFGLDNYGIKKVLPRLIMVAVLVNISFILCQLAVDVSNILGSALQGLFEGLADRIQIPKVFDGISFTGQWFSLSGIVSTVLTTLFTGGVVAALVVSWEIWLIPFLLALLGCVIGVLFFFVILGVRQAGVLILVALSPIAIVCYALPNTKNLFDKWKKMFIGLLVVYPICGLLIGGGQFASALLVSVDDGTNFFYDLVAMLIAVVPFFFIPSILRGSMVAMGNLGMKIAGFGSRFSTGVKRAIYGSEGGKEWQRQFNMRNAARTFNRLDSKLQKGGRLGTIASRRRSNAAARYNRLAMEDFKAGGNQELLLPGSRGMQKLETEQMVADTKGQRDLYSAQMNTGDMGAVGAEYEKQLEALQANPADRSAFVKVRALQDIMSESDPGRTEMRNRMLKMAQKYSGFYQSVTPGTDTALSMAAGHLMDNYNGLMKKSNRGTWSMLGHFQGGDFAPLFDKENGRIIGLDSKGRPLAEGASDAAAYTSTFYDQLGLNGYNAMSLIEADDAVRDGINRGIADGSISGTNKANIVSLASEAYGNQNVHFQPKVAEQIRKTLIDGNTATTIGGMDTGALERLAGDIEKGTLAGASRDKLVNMAKTALRTPGFVTNAEHAAQLNNILAAAGKETIPFAGQINTQSESADSGSINLRGGTAQGGRTSNGIILPDGQALDTVGDMLRQDQAKDAIRKANDRKFREK